MKARYTHTNIVARDWRRLAGFYQHVFGCVPVPPERHLEGEWLATATGVAGAALSGMHLKLPGYGDEGPTLEIFEYSSVLSSLPTAANRQGLGHIAFSVDDVSAALSAVVANGGRTIGDVVERSIAGVGVLTFTYAADPEGNMIELQHWGVEANASAREEKPDDRS
ncbi:MAG: VOC family protein [Chloroflexi bacterium]|nr:VOC family protein [Chloroflexota bacterium]